MTEPRAVIPAAMTKLERDWKMSPGVISNGPMFLTGVTGFPLEGQLSADPRSQIETALEGVEMVLTEAGIGFGDIVDITSFHVGLADHIDLFRVLLGHRIVRPYPAWTAIEVAGFATPGVIVELKVVARVPT